MTWNVFSRLKFNSRRTVVVIASVAISALGCTSVFALHAKNSRSTYPTPPSVTATRPIAAVENASSQTQAHIQTDAVTAPTSNLASSGNSVLKSSAKVPSAAASSSSIDFTLSQTSVTLSTTDKSPIIRATSTNGTALAWTVFSDNAIVVGRGDSSDYGITSFGLDLTHSFTFNASPALTKPGTYIITVEGYIPKGPKVDKQIAVTITQGATFKLLAQAPDYSQDTTTQFFIPFQIQPIYGLTLGSLASSASIISSNGSSMQVQGVQDLGGYYRNDNVVIYDNGQASGHLVVRVTVTDGIYTTSIDLPYDVQTQ